MRQRSPCSWKTSTPVRRRARSSAKLAAWSSCVWASASWRTHSRPSSAGNCSQRWRETPRCRSFDPYQCACLAIGYRHVRRLRYGRMTAVAACIPRPQSGRRATGCYRYRSGRQLQTQTGVYAAYIPPRRVAHRKYTPDRVPAAANPRSRLSAVRRRARSAVYPRAAVERTVTMLDLIYLLIGAAFLGACVLYVFACDHL